MANSIYGAANNYAQNLSQMGYNAGLPGLGISEPVGTPYQPLQTPAAVYGGYNGPGFIQGDTSVARTATGAPAFKNLSTPQAPAAPAAPAPTQNNGGSTGGDANSLIDALIRGGYNPTDARNAASGPNAANLMREYLGGGSGTSGMEGQIRSDINSGYDAYTQSLNDQLNNLLPQQKDSQEQIANNNFNQGLSTLGVGQQQGLDALGRQRTDATNNQNKNLRGLSENLRNMFMAGNVYLGARGAGDSSASNQYAYALSKVGSQARGDQMTQTADIMSKIGEQETNIRNVFANNVKELQTNKDNKIQEIANWFATAQGQLKQAVAQGQLNRSTDLANLSKQILTQAQTAMQQIQQESSQRYNSLLTWAENNSKTIGELKNNLSAVQQFALPGATQMNGQISSDARGNLNMNPVVGYGGGADTKKTNGIFPAYNPGV